jgi:hypothetical protein
MNTDFEKRSGQRKPILLVSGVAVAVCLFVAALLERRRAAAAADAARRRYVPTTPVTPEAERLYASADWAPAGPSGDPIWEHPDGDAQLDWLAAPVFDAEAEAAPFDAEPVLDADLVDVEPHVEDEPFGPVEASYEPHAEVETWQATPDATTWDPTPEVDASVEPAAAEFEGTNEPAPSFAAASDIEIVDEAEAWHEPTPDTDGWHAGPAAEAEVAREAEADPAPAADQWFGGPAPVQAWRPEVVETETEAGEAELHEAEVGETDVHATADPDEPGSVIELPPTADDAPPAETPKRVPPPRLRRFMGTGATVLVLGLVLGAGVLASGATADNTSDPSTVPDAVGTTAPLPVALPDATTDTTATDTTSTDTTSTDTTTTDTTTTDTTTTDTTTTGTTTTGTTTTDTTATATAPTDTTTTTPPPVDTTPTTPTPTTPTPSSDPAPQPVTPDASAPVVTPTPTTPAVVPPTSTTPAPPKPKAPTTSKPKTSSHTTVLPSKANAGSTAEVDAPATNGPAVVTLASGADPIGSILSANAAIPAVDASLLPTPAQVSFYVKASKPLPPLPTLVHADHAITQRLVVAGRKGKVGWTVLAAVARLESDFGKTPGPLVGRRLATPPTGTGLAALASFLHAHGATGNPLRPGTAKKALTLYFGGSSRKADRAIALAALYGALGPAGMQHGVRAETAKLQRRVLRDKRVHLTVAGRSDIRHGRVDPRVLVTLEYLANSFRKVGVSDLVSGGALFSRSGSVSAHLYGRAVDVSSLHGKKVRGHQGPGTMTEQAIRKLLLLPRSLRPRQIISLMDVDGPTGNHGSFALPDHYNRIQIDY